MVTTRSFLVRGGPHDISCPGVTEPYRRGWTRARLVSHEVADSQGYKSQAVGNCCCLTCISSLNLHSCLQVSQNFVYRLDENRLAGI